MNDESINKMYKLRSSGQNEQTYVKVTANGSPSGTATTTMV